MNPLDAFLTALYSTGVAVVGGIVLVRLWGERGRPVLAVYALAVAVRIAYLIGSSKLMAPDMYEYEEMALAALAGRGFGYDLLGTTYRAYGTPLYALVSAFVYEWVGHAPAILVLVGAAVAAAAAPFVYGLARRPFGERAALLAGVLAALHPGLVIYSGKLHALNLEATLAAALVLAAVWWMEGGRPRDAALTGIVAGLAGMSRPTVLVALVPLVVWWLWRSRPRSLGLRRAALAVAAAALVVAPWTLYVSQLYGGFVFMNMTGGIVFWYGNNPAATGSAIDASGMSLLVHAPPDLLRAVSDTDDVSADVAFRQAAWSYIQADPLAFVRRTATKLLFFWTFSPTMGTYYPGAWRGLYLAYYGLVVSFALLGLAEWLRHGRPAGHVLFAIAAVLAVVSSVQSLFYVDGRHRWEVEPLVLTLTAAGLAALLARIWPVRRSLRRPSS